MTDEPVFSVFGTREEIEAAKARIMKRLADRQAAGEAITRVVAGEPRQSFGAFAISFDEIEGPADGRP